MKHFNILVALVCSILVNDASAYDEKITHPQLTEQAINKSILDAYLQTYLGFSDGKKHYYGDKTIVKVLQEGSKNEDATLASMRAENHFWDPLFWVLNRPNYGGLNDWLSGESNKRWAMGDLDCEPVGVSGDKTTSKDCNDYSWKKARHEFYQAMISPDQTGRDAHFKNMYECLGRIIHLIEDMGVPAHTRNDFSGHLSLTGAPSYIGNLYESHVARNASPNSLNNPNGKYYISNLASLVMPSMIPKFNSPQEYWGRGDNTGYTGSNPDYTASDKTGLAEYTNANFLSKYTMFSSNFSTGDEHNFPYPRASSLDDYYAEMIVGRDGKKEIIWVFDKVRDGEYVHHFAEMNYLGSLKLSTLRSLHFDDNTSLRHVCNLNNRVHDAYAQKLIPKTIGYAAGLINYFFRGTIEISVPDTGYGSGVYAFIDNEPTSPRTQGFTKLSVMAKTTDPGQSMASGSVSLVARYRLPNFNPLQNFDWRNNTFSDYQYIASVKNNEYIPSDVPRRLDFDLTLTPIPLWAMDVSIYLVYKGALGKADGTGYVENDAVCVGYKDISEPTPVDFSNNDDLLCYNHAWYDLLNPDDLAQAESRLNQDGVTENIPNPIDFHEIYIKFFPVNSSNPTYPSLTDYDYKLDILPVGKYKRFYILADNTFGFSYLYNREVYRGSYINNATINKTELGSGATPLTWIYPTFTQYRGLYQWSTVNSTPLELCHPSYGCNGCDDSLIRVPLTPVSISNP